MKVKGLKRYNAMYSTVQYVVVERGCCRPVLGLSSYVLVTINTDQNSCPPAENNLVGGGTKMATQLPQVPWVRNFLVLIVFYLMDILGGRGVDCRDVTGRAKD
jgi:hypothetical protein